jgi:FdhD protein
MDQLPLPPGPLADEVACHLFLNDQQIVSLWCSPIDLGDLALGYLMSARGIESPGDLDSIEIESPGEQSQEGAWVVRVTSALDREPPGRETEARGSAGKPAGESPDSTGATPSGEFVLTLGPLREAARQVMEGGPLRKATGGVHSAGAMLPDGRVILREDVSRHCALDKAIGAAAREHSLREVVLLSSGRGAQEMIQKAVNVGVPVFATRGIPTTPAYRLAYVSGLTLIGQILSARPIAYTGGHRVRE